jgi:RimJ/RimL family protein N-acetyltransferase
LNILNTPVLKTENLILRKFNTNDIDALFAIHRDEDVNKFLPWFPLKSFGEAASFFQKNYAEAYQQGSVYKYAICLKADNIPIGYVNIGGSDSYDLGYGLKKEYWHKGIVTEACKALIEQLKKSGIPYITATHDVNNPRSGGVMKNIGMTYCYSYEEQCQPKNTLVLFRMYQLNFDGQNDRIYKKYWDTSSVHFVENGARHSNVT